MFKKGDNVQIKRNSAGLNYFWDRQGYVVQDQMPGCYVQVNIKINDNTYSEQGISSDELILIDNKIKNMNIKEKFVLALTKEPQKSFRKVGITNGDDILTEDGQKVFLSWLLHTKFAEDFKKEVVDDMLKDLEEEKK